MTQKELQDILRIQPGSLSEIVAKLEEKGLVRRQKDEEDRRRSVIELTETGREEALLQERQDDGSPTFGALNEQEQEAMKAMLRKLLESWK
jgi:DNA-binding MarR family transcriptional regulator